MVSSFALILVVVLALAFDFINGFHDTANTVATTISTRVLTPGIAIFMSAVCNFLGAFFNQKVAGTVAHDLVDNTLIDTNVIICAFLLRFNIIQVQNKKHKSDKLTRVIAEKMISRLCWGGCFT